MPIKVHIRDFQSLGNVELEIDGLTVVTGANNLGKSAVVRAIRGAFQNAKGTSFVRHGAPKTSVEIEFGDGHSLTWEKGRGKADKPTYIIDGGKPIHPGQGVPDEVKALGVRAINAGGREVWPQIARQFDGQIFLLDQPGSVMAEAVADLERVSQLNDALRLASSDLRAASSELGTRRSDIETLERELQTFAGLEEASQEVQDLEAQAALVQRIETALQGLRVLQQRRNAAQKQVQRLGDIEKVDIPEENIRDLPARLEETKRLRDRLNAAQAKVQRFQEFATVTVPETDVSAVLIELEALRKINQRRQKIQAQIHHLEQADLTAEVGDMVPLERLQNALQVSRGLRDHRRQAQSRVEEVEGELKQVEQEVEQATEELTGILGSQCPFCGSALHQAGAHA